MRFTSGLLLSLCFVLPVSADDWPQWMGPRRDSVWREKGIIESIPEAGLKVKWRAPVALGYAGPAVAGGRVFVPDFVVDEGTVSNNPGGRVKLVGQERVVCLDAKTGEELWTHADPQTYEISYPAGPRCTPTVDGDRLYQLGAEGLLTCLAVKDGKVVWQKKLKEEYKIESPIWGFTSHPLVDEKHVYLVVGGEGSVAVALDKLTGDEVWRALTAVEPGYCPPVMIERGGTRQLIIWHPQAVNSLNPATGEVYWSVPLEPNYGMSIAAPRVHGDFLFASGIGSAAALLQLAVDKPAAVVVWRGTPKTALYASNATPLVHGETIYGSDCQTGQFIAASLKDGERLWTTFEPTTGGDRRASHGTAFAVQHEDRFFLFSETGDLILANLTPEKYEELGRFHVVDPTNESFGRPVVWSHPAFAERSLFARNDKEIVCVDLSSGQ